MARYEVNVYGANAKVRNPWAVLGLTLITLGFYGWYWWYTVNREMRDFGKVYKDQKLAGTKPALSVTAYTIGGFVLIPVIWTAWTTVGRIRATQRIAKEPLTNGWIVFGLSIITLGLAFTPYLQAGLNRVWEKYPRHELGGDTAEPALEEGAAPAAAFEVAAEEPAPVRTDS